MHNIKYVVTHTVHQAPGLLIFIIITRIISYFKDSTELMKFFFLLFLVLHFRYFIQLFLGYYFLQNLLPVLIQCPCFSFIFCWVLVLHKDSTSDINVTANQLYIYLITYTTIKNLYLQPPVVKDHLS